MWYDEAVFYQIYPLGFAGAFSQGEKYNIKKVIEWIDHLKKLNINAVYFSPVFESDYHGYDTKDLRKIDPRLGTNKDFGEVISALHENGIRVIIDGVFNHVGRGFFAFRDVCEKKWESPYKDWFHISFEGNSAYDDGFWYEGWEGHFNLVKLNLKNPRLIDYILESVKMWVGEFDIDGIRLDVAYSLDHEFMKRLREFCDGLKPDFFLMGEMIHGDYKTIVNPQMLHSATNYECYKGLYSSFNSMNMFEIAHSLNRQFGSEPWALYRGMNLFSFVENHDVARIASTLTNAEHLPLIYGMLMTMPGIPCIYYAGEWGEVGRKEDGDENLRRAYAVPQENELTEYIGKLAKIRKSSNALSYGSFRNIQINNKQLIFERKTDEERIIVAINCEENTYYAHFDAGCGRAEELISGREHDFGGGSELPGYSVAIWKCER